MIPSDGGCRQRGSVMMGRGDDRQDQFFYEFNLDEVVPPDHLVRRIDAVLDLGWVHNELAPYYSHTGRPSIDPHDPHAHRRLRVCDPLRASHLR